VGAIGCNVDRIDDARFELRFLDNDMTADCSIALFPSPYYIAVVCEGKYLWTNGQ
jgi:hypothetical protein